MWDTVDDRRRSTIGTGSTGSTGSTAGPATGRAGCLSHDLPCAACGHAAHRFLACSDSCACVPPPLPGVAEVARVATPVPGEQRLTA